MPIVTWKDDYNVNVTEIDHQHQQMLNLVNDLHASVESHADKADLKSKLIELSEFTRSHFSDEERLMEEHGFPGLDEHQNQHRILLQHLEELVQAVSRGNRVTFYSDYDISSDWALSHIKECDKKLGDYLNSRDIF
jgi:hemerythrin-like metal-binding protein